MEPRSLTENSAVKEAEHSIPEDRLRCSSVSSVSSAKSASSEFSFDEQDLNDHGSFALISSNNAPTTPGGISTLETPPAQVMERSSDDTSGYRIPSHVFASKSGNPNTDWSTASNESLFSIHTGNMSFTRDQFSWLLKSGELGMYGGPGDIRKSGELPPPSPKIVPKPGEQKPVDLPKPGEQIPGDLPKPGEQIPGDLHVTGEKMTDVPSDTQKSGEQIIANHFKTSSAPPPVANKPGDVEVVSPNKVNEGGGAPDLTVNNKKDDPKQDMKAKRKDNSSMSDDVRPSTSVSHHSDASGQSFAFPVLTDIEREKSINSGHSRADRKNSTNEDGPKTPTSASQAAPTSTSWFSCFSRCSCC